MRSVRAAPVRTGQDRHDEAKRSCSPVCTPWRHMGEAEVQLHLFLTLTQMEVKCQLHTQEVIPVRKDAPEAT